MSAIEILDSRLTTGKGSNPTVTAPPGILKDELIVVLFTIRNTSAITPPAGFITAIAKPLSSSQSAVFYKIATASEPGSYSFSSGSGQKAVQVLRIGGDFDLSSPIGNTSGVGSSSDTVNLSVLCQNENSLALFSVAKLSNNVSPTFPLTYGETILFNYSASGFIGFGASNSPNPVNNNANFRVVHPPGTASVDRYLVTASVEIKSSRVREIYTRQSSIWSAAEEIHVRDSGVWKPANEILVRYNGVWKEVYK